MGKSCIGTDYGSLSFGLSFLGARFTDARLIGLAYAFEQRTLIRTTVRPYIEPKADLLLFQRSGDPMCAKTDVRA
jgi:hypothetical protein